MTFNNCSKEKQKENELQLLDRMDFDQCMKFNEWVVKRMEVIQKR